MEILNSKMQTHAIERSNRKEKKQMQVVFCCMHRLVELIEMDFGSI